MARFRFYLSIGLGNAKHKDIIEIEDDELEGLTPDEREKYIDGALQDWANGYLDMGFEEVEEDEDE